MQRLSLPAYPLSIAARLWLKRCLAVAFVPRGLPNKVAGFLLCFVDQQEEGFPWQVPFKVSALARQ